jgi:hypothetical protein
MFTDTEVILVHIWTVGIALGWFLNGLLPPDAPWWSWIVFTLAIVSVPTHLVRRQAIYARAHQAKA